MSRLRTFDYLSFLQNENCCTRILTIDIDGVERDLVKELASPEQWEGQHQSIRDIFRLARNRDTARNRLLLKEALLMLELRYRQRFGQEYSLLYRKVLRFLAAVDARFSDLERVQAAGEGGSAAADDG